MTPQRRPRGTAETAGWALLIAGLAVIVAGRCVHFFAHPEWTELHALRALWKLWSVGAALLLAGYRVVRLHVREG
jgi:hypothetical protein